MGHHVAFFVFICILPFIATQKSTKEEELNIIIDSDKEMESNSTAELDNPNSAQVQLKKELNGIMTIYAQFNFQDLPAESLDPMPALQKYFPHLAALLPIKQSGSRSKRAPATPAPGTSQSGFMGFLMQALCAQQAAPNNMFNPMSAMNPMGPLMNMGWRGKRRAAYSNRALMTPQRVLMSRMMSRRRRPTTPSPAMGQLNAAQQNAMMMNQMLPFIMMSQQANGAGAGGVGNDPATPGSQAAPGGGGGGGGGMDLSGLMTQAMCMQAAMSANAAALHPPEPGTAAAAGGMGGMGGMGMMGLFGR